MEHEILDSIALNNSRNLLEYPDDAVAIPIMDRFMVINIDGWVASTDRPNGMDTVSCGYRATINAISDIIAKGAIPKDIIVSLSTTDKDDVPSYLSGVKLVADKYNLNYLGGDLNQSEDTVIDIVAIGMADRLIKRSGAKRGDIVCWIGPDFGTTAAALGILLNNWSGSRSIALKIMNRPELFFEFIEYVDLLNISSSIDCSDGLASSLYMLASSSNVGMELFELKSNNWVEKIACDNGQQLTDLIFYGGEELGIIFTCADQKLPDNVIQIGKVVDGDKIMHQGEIIENKGWEHFVHK